MEFYSPKVVGGEINIFMLRGEGALDRAGALKRDNTIHVVLIK